MPSPEEQRTLTQFQILRDMQMDRMTAREQKAWRQEVAAMEEAFTEASAKASSDKAYKESADAVAKALPSLVKGIASARDAFAKGDYITGSAAMMDIAASALPALTAIFATAGPVGTLVGSLFSLVGQILSFFTPKQPSLESKIQTMLEHLQSEQQIQQMRAFGTSVSSYTDSLNRNAAQVKRVLSLPLTTTADVDTFMAQITALRTSLKMSHGRLDTPVFATWAVAAYLTREENWSKDGWPEVLGVWCETYANLLGAHLTLSCMLADGTLDARIIATREAATGSPLSEGARRRCHDQLTKLKGLLLAMREVWQSDNREVHRVLDTVRPVAQRRGVYLHLGYRSGGQVLYVGKADGRSGALSWTYKSNTAWLSRISVALPLSQSDSFAPAYDVIAKEAAPPRVYRHVLTSDTLDLSDGRVVIEPREGDHFYGFDAMTLTPAADTPNKTYLPLVARRRDKQHLDAYTVNERWECQREDRDLEIADALDVRCLYLPSTPVLDDPDGDTVKPGLTAPSASSPVDRSHPIHYVLLVRRGQVQVVTGSQSRAVEGPQGVGAHYGLEVDSDHLWLYGSWGIACTSHASVLAALEGKRPTPLWLEADLETAPRGHRTVTSLSPAADSTLLVGMDGQIFTAEYEIDRKRMRIRTSRWALQEGHAAQLVKVPIACWAVLESLRATLEAGLTDST